MLWACCGSSAHFTEKPIAYAIYPWKAMTKTEPAFAYPANPWVGCPNFRIILFIGLQGWAQCLSWAWSQWPQLGFPQKGKIKNRWAQPSSSSVQQKPENEWNLDKNFSIFFGCGLTDEEKYPAQQVLTQPIIFQNLGKIREHEICICWGDIYFIQMSPSPILLKFWDMMGWVKTCWAGYYCLSVTSWPC